MDMFPVSKVIRVKNTHLEKLAQTSRLKDVETILQELGFNAISDDGFFVTYENDKYTNTNKNTLVHIGSSEDVRDIIYTILQPEK